MGSGQIDYKNVYYPPGGILMWLLIFLELFTFGAVLIALVISSKENPEVYHQSRLHLNTTFGTINTIFLLVSGFFMATTVHLFKANNISKTLFYLKLTMLGGLLFLILKGIEYYLKIQSGFTMGYDSFFTYYWLLTGFHVIHVIVGLVILLFMFYGIKKLNKQTKLEDLEASAAFWHMCDLIWLLLFPTLYLIL
ncbi:cytochrome c oxidase subunit 3 [Aureibaculum conchae]|uniref:cytochrome c oxidase subunit 3 n=1 Tax=Aureibaculum sp. 2308TA14-22 TaxID=3108392 RepID=UPI0033996024